MPPRPKLVGDKDRLIPAPLRAKALTWLAQQKGAGWAWVRLAVRLADQAGLRASEIVHLRVQDCDVFGDPPHRLFIVGGKMRAKDHVDEQPIPDDLATELRKALKDVEPSRYVVGGGTEPYTRQHLHARVKELHARVQIGTVYNVHSWRHGYGTLVYKQTKDLVLTQRLMRHSKSTTTERYVHMAEMDERVGAAMRAIAWGGADVAPAKTTTKVKAKAGRR